MEAKMEEILKKLDDVIKETAAIESANNVIDLPANRYIVSQIGMALSNLSGARHQLFILNEIQKKWQENPSKLKADS
jgi:hypothetical protein